MVRFLTLAFLIGLSSESVWAHPGHGNPQTQDGLLHYVLSPVHSWPTLLLIVSIGLLIAGAGRIFRNRSDR
ncbi:MAG: hypothetical protein KDA81_10445 [Planctomycetaceae bacterium]|nr:hypothetical protein [Planctomycetaceae bacterium]